MFVPHMEVQQRRLSIEEKLLYTKWFENVRTIILPFYHHDETYLNFSHSVTDKPRVPLSSDNLLFS